jgi:hypothetical protein
VDIEGFVDIGQVKAGTGSAHDRCSMETWGWECGLCRLWHTQALGSVPSTIGVKTEIGKKGNCLLLRSPHRGCN